MRNMITFRSAMNKFSGFKLPIAPQRKSRIDGIAVVNPSILINVRRRARAASDESEREMAFN